uniref:Uncharacterized protein n=1 Tax=Solibacter usitatus (strain Ellin6076) TaxID=234267 RepID=Q027D2_SOLUE
MMTLMEERTWLNLRPAFWLAPLLSTIPLIPFFSLPSSPLYLGKLMGDPTHPFLWPHLGPWLAAMAVIFDGTLLGYFATLLMAVPAYFLFKMTGRSSVIRVLILFSLAGILASQLVHVAQWFRQPGLRDFAGSWLSPLFGCLCGLISGACFAISANRRYSLLGKALIYSLPVAALLVCGSTLMWSARAWRVH